MYFSCHLMSYDQMSHDLSPFNFQLVNGDVSLGFHHQGFTERTKTSVVSTVLTPDTKNQSWLDDTSSILSEVRNAHICFMYSHTYL